MTHDLRTLYAYLIPQVMLQLWHPSLRVALAACIPLCALTYGLLWWLAKHWKVQP